MEEWPEVKHLGYAMILASVFVTLIACGADPAAEGPAKTQASGSTRTSPSDAEVFFPELKKPHLTPLLPLVGKLLLDREGCLRVDDPTFAQDDPGYVPVWPPQYKPDAEGDDVRILDGKGRVVARVGEKVDMGGGEIDRATLEERNFMGERLARELFERCPGRYWLISDGEVKIPGRG
jgi:hypothetical protein